MPNKRILKNSTVLLVLLIFSTLAWGDQRKTEKTPAPSRPAPQVKSAPAPRSAPSRRAAQQRDLRRIRLDLRLVR